MTREKTSSGTLELIFPESPSSPITLLYVQSVAAYSPRLPHVIFFTGFGEQRRASLAAAIKPFSDRGFSATSVAIPFDKHSLHSARWLLDKGLSQAVNTLRLKDRSVILAGISRGAAIAAGVTAGAMTPYDGLVMVSPLGLARLRSSTYLRNSIGDHIKNKSFLDKEARQNAYAVLGEMIRHIRSGDGLINALRFAMSQQDRVEKGVTSTVENGKLLAIFSGEQDMVFTPAQCRLTLIDLLGAHTARKVLHTMPGGHAATASRAGQRQLELVADRLKSYYLKLS